MPRVNPSSPVYTGLQPDLHATAHLILAQGDGLSAVIDLFAQAGSAFTERAALLYTTADAVLLPQSAGLQVNCFPNIASLLREGAHRLQAARMGTAIYLSGRADFIAEAANLAALYGVSRASLRTECRGHAGKRVQCVHCKSIQSDVLTPTVTCAQCGLSLLVRDHYSHRLQAFMGVYCEAEKLS